MWSWGTQNWMLICILCILCLIFRIWNSSAGIPSSPIALYVVILPKADLTLHSKMSGSRWVITPLWLSESLSSFLHSSSVYSCYLFFISSASVQSMPFLSYIVPTFAWNVPLVYLTFLKRCLVFPILLFSSTSLHCSFKKASYLSLLLSGTQHSVEYIFPFLLWIAAYQTQISLGHWLSGFLIICWCKHSEYIITERKFQELLRVINQGNFPVCIVENFYFKNIFIYYLDNLNF